MVAPSQVPPGEYPNAPMPKELEEHEIEEILGWYESAARRAIAAGLDGVEFHMSHGYLPWQFLSPLYNQRQDRWGGSYENRLRFPVEAMTRIRAAIGDEPFIGYRINSTSFWPGDLELEDIKRIVGDLERECRRRLRRPLGRRPPLVHPHADDLRGRLGARVHARGEDGVDEARAARRPDHEARRSPRSCSQSGDADAILLARQLFADAEWAKKARDGQGRRHPPLRRRELLLALGDPRRPRAVHLQPDGRARARLGRGDARPRRVGEARARRRRRPGRARVRARRGGARARGRRARTRGRGRRSRALVLEAAGPRAVLRDRRSGSPRRRAGTAPRSGLGEEATARRVLEGFDHVVVATGARYRGRRLPGPDGRPAARARDRPLRRAGTTSRSARSRRAATCSCSTTSRTRPRR